MLMPEKKATVYATGAVGTAASKIEKGTIAWRDRPPSRSLHLLPRLVLPFTPSAQCQVLPCQHQEAQAPWLPPHPPQTR
jgi:hypothetical protein